MREWDTTAIIELPSLEGHEIVEFEAIVYQDRVDSDLFLDTGVIDVIRAEIEPAVQPPYSFCAVRQDARTWAVGARAISSTVISLGVSAASLQVACPPGDDRSVVVDGEFVTEPFDPELEKAIRRLEELGQNRFKTFVARANKVEADRWDLTIDPL